MLPSPSPSLSGYHHCYAQSCFSSSPHPTRNKKIILYSAVFERLRPVFFHTAFPLYVYSLPTKWPELRGRPSALPCNDGREAQLVAFRRGRSQDRPQRWGQEVGDPWGDGSRRGGRAGFW